MPRKHVIAVIGSGRETEPAVSNARELGRLIAENGWVLVTGGRNTGVMTAASEGAKEDTGEARNNIIVLTADVIVACGVDGPGTASEVSLAIKAQKPLILLGADEAAGVFFWNIGKDLVYPAATPADAIRIIYDRALLR
jgi:predicted Rossmann-fold nucleotide-binding protein